MRRRPGTQSGPAAMPMRVRWNGRASPRGEQSGRASVGGRRRLDALRRRFGRRGGWWSFAFRALLAPLERASAGPVLAAIDAYALDPARVGIEHLDLEAARPGDKFAAHRHPADP